MTFHLEVTESGQSQHPRSFASIGVTNGSENVSFGISDQQAALSIGRTPRNFHIGLTPAEAINLAVALLNAAENVENDDWGGRTNDLGAAAAYLGTKVER